MTYFIKPTDPARIAAWFDLLGRDTLPVRDYRPRPGESGPVFDVDIARLTAVERARLAGHIAKTKFQSFYESMEQLSNVGAAVPAIGCELIVGETAVTSGGGA